MEGQIIAVPFEYMIAVVVGLVAAITGLVTATVYIFKRNESKNKIIVDLTKSFYESTKDHAKALENNTRVIEKLPETIMLHFKANGK